MRIRSLVLSAAVAVAVALPIAPAHSLMCSRELQQVCSTVFGPLCTVKPSSCPR